MTRLSVKLESSWSSDRPVTIDTARLSLSHGATRNHALGWLAHNLAQALPLPFGASNLEGHPILAGHAFGNGFGSQLPVEYHDSIRHADYVIRSYSTPIAWRVPATDTEAVAAMRQHVEVNGCDLINDEHSVWIIPDHKYSRTTSRQQSTISAALTYARNSYSVESVKAA